MRRESILFTFERDTVKGGFPGSLVVKNLIANAGDVGSSLG